MAVRGPVPAREGAVLDPQKQEEEQKQEDLLYELLDEAGPDASDEELIAIRKRITPTRSQQRITMAWIISRVMLQVYRERDTCAASCWVSGLTLRVGDMAGLKKWQKKMVEMHVGIDMEGTDEIVQQRVKQMAALYDAEQRRREAKGAETASDGDMDTGDLVQRGDADMAKRRKSIKSTHLQPVVSASLSQHTIVPTTTGAVAAHHIMLPAIVPTPSGMRNLGGTCYVNSWMQAMALAGLEPVLEKILELERSPSADISADEWNSKRSAVQEACMVLYELLTADVAVIKASAFTDALPSPFNSHTQHQDVTEFHGLIASFAHALCENSRTGCNPLRRLLESSTTTACECENCHGRYYAEDTAFITWVSLVCVFGLLDL